MSRFLRENAFWPRRACAVGPKKLSKSYGVLYTFLKTCQNYIRKLYKTDIFLNRARFGARTAHRPPEGPFYAQNGSTFQFISFQCIKFHRIVSHCLSLNFISSRFISFHYLISFHFISFHLISFSCHYNYLWVAGQNYG